MKGFSRANLMYMRSFAEAWPDAAIVQQAVGQLPWGHNLVLLARLKQPEQRLVYAQRAVKHGWSRATLEIHIESRLLEREGQGITNFAPWPVEHLPHRRRLQVNAEQDNPTIGLLLCKSKNTVVAEYQLIESLPEELKTSLPSTEQIERELGGEHE